MTTGNIRSITAVFLPAGLLFFWYNIYEGWDTDRRGLAQDWIGKYIQNTDTQENALPWRRGWILLNVSSGLNPDLAQEQS